MSEWQYNFHPAEFSALLGLTLSSIKHDPLEHELLFKTTCGREFIMHHYQSCCEVVSLEDIVGDLDDLVGSPILRAEMACSADLLDDNINTSSISYFELDKAVRDIMLCRKLSDNDSYYEESETWTFYKLATIKGSVDLRWHGSSNGYYSERVDFDEIKD